MKKTIYEIKEDAKTEYKRLKKKKVKALPLWLLIIAIILGWYFYVSDVQKTQERVESQLERLEQTIEDKFKSIDENFHKQDDKINNVKEAKAKEKARVALLQSPRPRPVQPVLGGCEQYRPLVSQYAWNVDVALAVMKAESGCDPNKPNWNDSHRDRYGNLICKGSFGLMQISCHSGQVYDPVRNIAIAYQKYVASGNRFDTTLGWKNTCTYKVKCV